MPQHRATRCRLGRFPQQPSTPAPQARSSTPPAHPPCSCRQHRRRLWAWMTRHANCCSTGDARVPQEPQQLRRPPETCVSAEPSRHSGAPEGSSGKERRAVGSCSGMRQGWEFCCRTRCHPARRPERTVSRDRATAKWSGGGGPRAAVKGRDEGRGARHEGSGIIRRGSSRGGSRGSAGTRWRSALPPAPSPAPAAAS